MTTEPLRHVRPPRPLRFPVREPEDERMGEGQRHLLVKTFLFALLREAYRGTHAVGCEQFVYWNGADARRVLCPDVFVKLGSPRIDFDTWKTWEHGVPELAVEILSPSDTPERWAFHEKLERYQELGVRELVCANLDAAPGARVRVWDRIEEDLVERVVEGDQTPCQSLGLLWVLGPADDQPLALRLASPEGELLPSPREAAAGRIAELEEELRRARAHPR